MIVLLVLGIEVVTAGIGRGMVLWKLLLVLGLALVMMWFSVLLRATISLADIRRKAISSGKAVVWYGVVYSVDL